MGTFSRLRYVIAANVNALIEKAEDPEKLLRALIREMEDATEEAREAAAQLLAEQQQLKRLDADLSGKDEEWTQRAEKAVAQDRDDLARAALAAREEVGQQQQSLQRELAAVNERVAQLEQDMSTLKDKLADAKLKLKSLQARGVPAANGRIRQDLPTSPGEQKMQRALGRFDRLQNQLESLEVRVRSYDLAGPPAAVWTGVEAVHDEAIEQELATLKQKLAGGTEVAGSGAEQPLQAHADGQADTDSESTSQADASDESSNDRQATGPVRKPVDASAETRA